MACQSSPELTIGQIPDLDGAVPGPRDDHRVNRGGRESNAAHPVAVGIGVLDCVFAFSEGIPELDRSVAGGGDDLSVVGGKSDTEDILGVPDEASGGDSDIKIPEAQGRIPGARQSELAVGGDDDVVDEVGMARQPALGDAVRAAFFAAGGFFGEVPDKDRFVP